MWSIRRPPARSPFMKNVTSPPVAGAAASASNSIRTSTVPVGSFTLDEHAHHRVGVLELAVVDVRREAAEMVSLGDDHAFGSAFGDLERGGDRVGVVVDPGDHSRGDVLDRPVVRVCFRFAYHWRPFSGPSTVRTHVGRPPVSQR